AKQENQIPQTFSPDSNQRAIGNIVSVPDIPLPAAGIIVVPPANQIAVIHNLGPESFGRGGAAGSSTGAGNSAGTGQHGAANGHGASTRESAAPGAQAAGRTAFRIASASEKEPAGGRGNAPVGESYSRVRGAGAPAAA